MASRKKTKQQPKSADTEPAIYFANQTTSDVEDAKFAVLRLDAEMVAYFLQLMATAARVKKREPSLYGLSFFRSLVRYYRTFTEAHGDWWLELLQNDDSTAAEITDTLDQEEWVRMPAAYYPPATQSRVDCEMLHVTDESVCFSCYPHHGSRAAGAETTRFFKEELLAAARCLRKLRDKV